MGPAVDTAGNCPAIRSESRDFSLASMGPAVDTAGNAKAAEEAAKKATDKLQWGQRLIPLETCHMTLEIGIDGLGFNGASG